MVQMVHLQDIHCKRSLRLRWGRAGEQKLCRALCGRAQGGSSGLRACHQPRGGTRRLQRQEQPWVTCPGSSKERVIAAQALAGLASGCLPSI